MERLCEMCEEPISKKRLKTVPKTKYCIRCLEELEAEGKGTVRTKGYQKQTFIGHRLETIDLEIETGEEEDK